MKKQQQVINATVSIILKSFEIPKLELPNTKEQNAHQIYSYTSLLSSVRLPKKHTLYTVLRSPHIDKKSREQFEMKIHKQLIVIQSTPFLLRAQLLRLKFQDIPGVQCKIIVNYKTRLLD